MRHEHRGRLPAGRSFAPALKGCLLLWTYAVGMAQSPPAPMQEVGAANLPAQRIGVNDLVAISVYRSPELTRTLRVEPGGTLKLPLLEQPVRAAGLLPNQLEEEIAAALRAGGILVNPVVKVSVVEYASRPVSVVGAVRKPLTFQAMGRVTLLDAIARAEGLSEAAGEEILLTRTQEAAAAGANAVAGPSTIRIPVSKLFGEADPAWNLLLEGGEEIRVPEAGKVFVVGNVRRPGAYPVSGDSGASVLKALAMAEGLAPFATRQAYVYRRRPDREERQEIVVELDRILARQAPDQPLEPGDVLYVPDNKGKRAAITVIDRVTSFGVNTVSGVLIWRR